jgi:hypothetical protein
MEAFMVFNDRLAFLIIAANYAFAIAALATRIAHPLVTCQRGDGHAFEPRPAGEARRADRSRISQRWILANAPLAQRRRRR